MMRIWFPAWAGRESIERRGIFISPYQTFFSRSMRALTSKPEFHSQRSLGLAIMMP